MRPYRGYILGKVVENDTGVVTTTGVEDTMQKYEVIRVGSGHYEFGELIQPDVEEGDTVFIQKHADADNPKELQDQGLCLFLASRIIGVQHD